MVGSGAGGDSRSKEAVGMMALHEALRNVCLNSDWTYSVFWTIRPRPCTPLLSTSSTLNSPLVSLPLLKSVTVLLISAGGAEEGAAARWETTMAACELFSVSITLSLAGIRLKDGGNFLEWWF